MSRVFQTPFRVLVVSFVLALRVPAAAQSKPAVTAATDGRTFTVTANTPYDHLSLRVAAPDGRTFDTNGSGGAVRFDPFAISGYTPPDGSYTWETRLMPRGAISPALTARVRRDRESRDRQTDSGVQTALRRAVVVQSGGFAILGGKMIAGQGSEPRAGRRQASLERDRPRVGAGVIAAGRFADRVVSAFDDVIPDDLIVQGSACIGLDCVNNESFGFDTIRLKENNLRIKFEDTSVAAGFPTNDWQLTANDSASGGLSKFSIDDVTGARTPFTVEAGTPTNALYVSSTGRIGFNTATPVLELHANTADTPALRMEQNGSGGFTAQTWDVAGNEANWFVRDVTGGSRLPFRIRPGARSSSIDIAASGRIGIGTASPQSQLHVFGAATADTFVGIGPNPGGGATNASALNIGHAAASVGRGAGFFNVRPDSLAVAPNPSLRFFTANVERLIITNTGNVGVGTSNPANPIQTASGAHVTAGGVWTNASSRGLKDEIQPLTAGDALAAFADLKPVRFVYRVDPAERHVGFIAEDVPDLVATADRKTLSPMDLVAVLTRVVQEQQQAVAAQEARIAALTARIAALEAARH